MKKFSIFAKATVKKILNDFFEVWIGLILLDVVWSTYHDPRFVSSTGFQSLFMWSAIVICTLVGVLSLLTSTISLFENANYLWRYRSDIYEK